MVDLLLVDSQQEERVPHDESYCNTTIESNY